MNHFAKISKSAELLHPTPHPGLLQIHLWANDTISGPLLCIHCPELAPSIQWRKQQDLGPVFGLIYIYSTLWQGLNLLHCYNYSFLYLIKTAGE